MVVLLQVSCCLFRFGLGWVFGIGVLDVGLCLRVFSGFAGNFDLLVLLRGLCGVIQAVAGCGFLLGSMIALVCGFSGRLVGVERYLFGVGWDCCCVSGVFLRFFGWFGVCLGGDSGFSVGVLLLVCVCAFWCGFVGFLCLLGISF